MRDKYKILVVNEEELDVVKQLQELESFKIEMINSAIKAYEKVKSEKNASIDIGMADMDGLELLKKIKTYDALIEIVMMSSYSTMEKILNSPEYGANDHVVNPFGNLEEVKKIISYSIEKLESRRESIIEKVK